MRRRGALVAMALAGTVVVAPTVACSSPRLSTSGSRCAIAPDNLLQTIGAKLDTAGQLRNGRTVAQGATTFISAELHKQGDKPDEKGDILTWATPTPAPASGAGGPAGQPTILAVDIHARDTTTWPDADFDVRRAGVEQSRACTDSVRGTTVEEAKCRQQATQQAPKGLGFKQDNCKGKGQ